MKSDRQASRRGLPDIKSARRTLEILELLARRREGLAVQDVCRHLKIPQSSASGLLKSLAELGYLEFRSQERRYVPTVRVVFLGYWLYADLYSGGAPFRLAEHLHRLTEETISIGIRDDCHVVYLRIIQSTKSLQYFLDPRVPRPLCHSGAGRALMLSLRKAETLSIIARTNREVRTLPNKVSERKLLADLDASRRRGYVFLESSWIEGAASIAMPIPTPAGFPKIAVAIGGPVHRLKANRTELVGILRQTLDDYSKGKLGS